MIEIRNLCVDYKEGRAIDNLNLDIQSGKLTVLAAPNGGGKSTLLKTICGLIEKTEGSILIDGKDTAAMSRQERAKKTAYMLQTRNTPNIQAKRMVLHGRFPYLSYPRKYGKKDYEIAAEAMEKADVQKLADSFLPELSGGERQRVYLAMTLAQDTEIVLMDEPMNFLDVKHQLELLELAKNLAAEGRTVVMVIHDIRIAMQEADELVILNGGSLAAAGTPDEILKAGIIKKVFGADIGFVETGAGRRFYYI